jgi:hypothetical protein
MERDVTRPPLELFAAEATPELAPVGESSAGAPSFAGPDSGGPGWLAAGDFT